MTKWTLHDRWGNEIYLTEERWQHILERHDELTDLLDEVLETLKRGKRRVGRKLLISTDIVIVVAVMLYYQSSITLLSQWYFVTKSKLTQQRSLTIL